MVSSCSAFGCTNRYVRNSGIGFFRFPRKPVRRKLWTLALRRKNFEPTRASVVCGEHFQTGRPSRDPDHPDYVPNIFIFKLPKKTGPRKKNADEVKNQMQDNSDLEMHDNLTFSASSNETGELSGMKNETLLKSTELQSARSVLKPLEIRNKELSKELDAANIIQDTQQILKSLKKNEITKIKLELNDAYTTLNSLTSEKNRLLKEISVSKVTQSILNNSVSQKEEELLKLKEELQLAYSEISVLRPEKQELQKKLSDADLTQSILKDLSKLYFYTGLNSVKDFHLILSLLSNVESSVRSVPLETQLLIVLMKLKQNLLATDLAYRFQTSGTTVGRICATIMPILEEKLDLLFKSPVGHALRKNIPTCLNNTVYENLYQTMHNTSKAKQKLSDDEEDSESDFL